MASYWPNRKTWLMLLEWALFVVFVGTLLGLAIAVWRGTHG